MQMEEMHKQAQDGLFRPSQKRLYGQNQKIYDYYNELEHERQAREREVEQKMVHEVLDKSLRAQDERARQEELKKAQDKERMRGLLDMQVR